MILRTVLILFSLLLIVGGVTLAWVTGLDPLYSAVGLLGVILGVYGCLRFNRNQEHSLDPHVITEGRSYQKPLSSAEQKESIAKTQKLGRKL
jgi:hypothetical protein